MNIFYFNFSFVPISVLYLFNRKPITVYQRSLDYLHLLFHGNCMYELAGHVRVTHLYRDQNSYLVLRHKRIFMVYLLSDSYC